MFIKAIIGLMVLAVLATWIMVSPVRSETLGEIKKNSLRIALNGLASGKSTIDFKDSNAELKTSGTGIGGGTGVVPGISLGYTLTRAQEVGVNILFFSTEQEIKLTSLDIYTHPPLETF